MPADRYWDENGREYRLVCDLVSYPRFEKREIDGRMVLVKLPPTEFSVCTAVPVGNAGDPDLKTSVVDL